MHIISNLHTFSFLGFQLRNVRCLKLKTTHHKILDYFHACLCFEKLARYCSLSLRSTWNNENIFFVTMGVVSTSAFGCEEENCF